MRIGIIFFIVSFFSLCGLQAQMVVYPVPQEVKWGQQMVEIPAGFQLSGETTADAVAVNQLKSLLKGEKNKAAKFTICIGKRGDKAVRKYASSIPLHPEGYYLSVTKDRIVLAGNDERGTFYAVQTLRQLLQENGVPEVEIKDYPVVRFRGVVEGFYGTPWSHEARLRQLAFYGENKMNTYIYGPKDDPYHSCPNWRKRHAGMRWILSGRFIRDRTSSGMRKTAICCWRNLKVCISWASVRLLSFSMTFPERERIRSVRRIC